MSFTTCPVAIIDAPSEKVWSLLDTPENYARWWDAETCAIIPQGSAQPGQRIFAETREFGRKWKLSVQVERIDEAGRQLDLRTSLPFGISMRNHFTCSPVGERQCLVSFG
jgi:ligand-binding SRPBCC domain-containing protein